ncbi:hypothetical protein LIER_13265 [Lithospermum erythrorhizon]|uniref:Uncharacterized protein n=1 Tax=Lithospermum erythrorhizon TaxID=34254 RepID=A0AAV3PUZ8_LITER
MDVTFAQNQAFYAIISLQGENKEEDQFWKCHTSFPINPNNYTPFMPRNDEHPSVPTTLSEPLVKTPIVDIQTRYGSSKVKERHHNHSNKVHHRPSN